MQLVACDKKQDRHLNGMLHPKEFTKVDGSHSKLDAPTKKDHRIGQDGLFRRFNVDLSAFDTRTNPVSKHFLFKFFKIFPVVKH